jgi:large subunit ribosomal protein L32
MAVPKSRIPRRRRGNRRSHDALSNPALTIDNTTGETHRRHHMTPDGFHKGRQIIEKAAISVDDEE